MEEKVVLVDEKGREVGVEEKIKAHVEGKFHRAVSIIIFNSKREMLIQKRARNKYHSAGLWSNACCSHPKPLESVEEAAHRRLKEEMGFDCDLKKVFEFVYKKEFENGLVEWEYDHVFLGKYDGNIIMSDEKEIEEWKWVNVEDLKKDMEKNPENYSYWFKKILGVLRSFRL
jgi:isopentenyl-diphosphate delta-isomerase